MRRFVLFVAGVCLCGAMFAGVHKVPQSAPEPDRSAGLFVGVRDFPEDDELNPVKYAVDDAIDLAYELAMSHQPRLVPPDRVVLALSGSAQKPESQKRLEQLQAAGAVVDDASQAHILKLLHKQASVVGGRGVLFVSFATHGISQDGVQYLLTQTSLHDEVETAITDTKMRDIIAKRADRSLIVIDACRERLRRDNRTGIPDPQSRAAFLHGLDEIHGQVVLSAATPGNYAYDDDDRKNGVFTATLIDALRCGGATPNAQGVITADAVATFVEAHVLTWVRQHKDPELKKATQRQFDGRSNEMPLTICPVTRTVASASHLQP